MSSSDTIEIQNKFLQEALGIIAKTQETMQQLAGWLFEFTSEYGKTESFKLASSNSMPSGTLEQLEDLRDAVKAGIIKLLWNEFHSTITLSHDHLNLRGQRRIVLSYLVDDLAQITSANSELAAGAIKVRDSAVEYLALIQQTDAAIESDFVLSSSSSQLWTTNSAVGKTYQVNLAVLSSVSDRVAYLLAYCNERLDNATDSEFRRLVAPLAPSFRALGAELYAAMDLTKAFQSLAKQALSARRPPRQEIRLWGRRNPCEQPDST